jgi:hypothetical protein
LKAHILLSAIAIILLVPILALAFGEWYAYWGHALLAIVFGILLVWTRTHNYWEEE